MTISHAAVGSLQLPATPHTESLPPWQTWMSQGASSQASGQLLQSPCGHGPTPESRQHTYSSWASVDSNSKELYDTERSIQGHASTTQYLTSMAMSRLS